MKGKEAAVKNAWRGCIVQVRGNIREKGMHLVFSCLCQKISFPFLSFHIDFAPTWLLSKDLKILQFQFQSCQEQRLAPTLSQNSPPKITAVISPCVRLQVFMVETRSSTNTSEGDPESLGEEGILRVYIKHTATLFKRLNAQYWFSSQLVFFFLLNIYSTDKWHHINNMTLMMRKW